MDASERLGRALHESMPASHYTRKCTDRHDLRAATILAADPGLGSAIDLGLAWQEAEAALPEGWFLLELLRSDDRTKWWALANEYGMKQGASAYGATPAGALRNLAAKLRDDRE